MSSGKCIETGCEKWAQFERKCIGHANVPHIGEGYMTHGEIALLMGITTSAVWQIERRALIKVRKAFKQRGYSLPDFIEVR